MRHLLQNNFTARNERRTYTDISPTHRRIRTYRSIFYRGAATIRIFACMGTTRNSCPTRRTPLPAACLAYKHNCGHFCRTAVPSSPVYHTHHTHFACKYMRQRTYTTHTALPRRLSVSPRTRFGFGSGSDTTFNAACGPIDAYLLARHRPHAVSPTPMLPAPRTAISAYLHSSTPLLVHHHISACGTACLWAC